MHPLELIDFEAQLSEEERAIRDVTRAIVDDIVRPKIAHWWEEGDLPVRELMRAFGDAGLLGMHLTGYGCPGTSATAYGLAALELEAGDSGVRSMVSVQGSLAMFAIHRFGSDTQREQWLPGMAQGSLIGCFGLTEADFGSNPAGMRTRATQSGSDWVLNGSKMWITNGSLADAAIIWAQTDAGVRGFLVPTDTPGFQSNVIHHKVSLRASITSELVLQDVRLPADALLPDAQGLKAPLQCLNEARFGIIFGTMGSARDCLEATLGYAGDREQFDKPIAGFQLTQKKLVDMAVELNKGVLLALHLGRIKDAGGITPEQVSLGKLNNARAALNIARECRAILGGNGITLEYPVIRHMNNLESVFTYEGTHEMHTLVIGQALTGLAAFR
jgi:glutaryl-CoA dehydrogenase